MQIPIQSADVALSSRGDMDGLLDVVLEVLDGSAVSGAAGVGTFAVVLYLSLNFEISFAISATAYTMTRSPQPPSVDTFAAVVLPASEYIKLTLPQPSPTSSALLPPSWAPPLSSRLSWLLLPLPPFLTAS